ncbi:MAG: glucosamine-6-phosphate deaminase [Phycisphaerae bacterium]
MSHSPHPKTHLEHIPTHVFADNNEAARQVAQAIAQTIREHAAQKKPLVLGLATGHTPIGIYRELIRLHQTEGLDLSGCITFNLDEYYPMEPDSLQSYHRWMRENFFDHVNIPAQNIHIPDGRLLSERVDAFCEDYEQAIQDAGGIDIQILGVGRTGHIGFNEPGSDLDSRTRIITLDRVTRLDAASDFFGEENVPRQALTMGVGTILEARRIFMLAFGEHKAPIVREAIEGPITPTVAASFLQKHPNAAIYLDSAAAAHLTRFATPWKLGRCSWDAALIRKASIWLARQTNTCILKLTNEHYNEHGLQELLNTEEKGAYEINRRVFRDLQTTITGWPGGKAEKKRALIFSPHPDDDVISMGGTLIRLVDQKHDVQVAYMTSGDIAVFDHEALRFMDFVREFNTRFALDPEKTTQLRVRVDQAMLAKKPAQIDATEIQTIKNLIRRSEARAAGRHCGIPAEKLRFLNLPFYQTGTVRKNPIGPEDVKIVVELLRDVQPEILFAAGDLSDPHGTHRMCLEAVRQALHECRNDPWRKNCDLWLYRGAWAEWEPYEIEMAVPLSPDEMHQKRMAIFKHESQKDNAMFPGPYDSRQFWQRSEDRNKNTANLYNLLGLAEYQGIEGFVRWHGV